MPLGPKLATAVLVLLPVTALSAEAQEKSIRRRDLPPAVEKTVAEASSGATIRGFSTEMDNGKRIYEAELSVNGHTKDISMDERGKVIEIEEEISIDSLSTAVKDALAKATGSGTLGKVESLTKNGKLVAYEAVVKRGTKRSEIQVGPEGKKLAHPE